MLRWCLLALLAVSVAEARPPKRTPAGPPVEAVGYGANADEAQAAALANAAEAAGVEMQLLRTLAIVEVGEATPSALLKGEPLMEVRVTVVPTRELHAASAAAGKARVAASRQAGLVRVVIALVVAFGLVAGYLRLEERTKGYAIRLWRVLAALIALVTGVALWLVG